MGLGPAGVFEQPDENATPLAPEEMRDLIPSHIAYRSELNYAEQRNIIRAQDWALSRRSRDVLNEKFVKDLHGRMLGDVWRWAGKFRTSERNLGIDYWEIPVARATCWRTPKRGFNTTRTQPMKSPSAFTTGWFRFIPSRMGTAGTPV